jgi:hypothetical protein
MVAKYVAFRLLSPSNTADELRSARCPLKNRHAEPLLRREGASSAPSACWAASRRKTAMATQLLA